MITPNRAIALYHLRMNPHHHKQAKKALLNGSGCRCALGLIAEAFNIPVSVDREYSYSNAAVYNQLEKMLETITIPIFSLNDNYDLTFEQIADVLEKTWSEASEREPTAVAREMGLITDDLDN